MSSTLTATLTTLLRLQHIARVVLHAPHGSSRMNLSLVGWTRGAQTEQAGMRSFSLADVRRIGSRQVAQQVLAGVPASAAILLHLDIDVFRSSDLPAAYFPHPEGLSLKEGTELLGVFLRDARVRVIEVSEYATLRDREQESVNKIIEMLVQTLPK
jgi:arginase